MNSDSDAAPLAIHARGLVKQYEQGRIVALDGLDLDVKESEFVAVCGPSGCGKSTLLNLISAIDRPDAGQLSVYGRLLADSSNADANRFRSSVVGLVFQLHNLLPGLTALENVQVPMLATGRDRNARVQRARDLLARVGLDERQHALPTVLSGGERQRVAVARALANGPRLLLADEPTGSIDSKTGEKLFDLLTELQADFGTTLLVVTHDHHVAARANRVVHMLDGRIDERPDR